MNKVNITRLYDNLKNGTIGMLYIDGVPFCMTLERPFIDNKVNISSIPEGEYTCRPYTSPKFKDVYEVVNVPGRSAILLHPGNRLRHTKGCILLGETIDKVFNAVWNSGKTYQRFRDAIGKHKFKLVIGKVTELL